MTLSTRQLAVGTGYALQHYKTATFEQQQMLTRLQLQPSDNVVVFGCGSAVHSCWIAQHVDYIVATDNNPTQLAIARQLQQLTVASSLALVRCAVESTNLKQHFDVVILHDVVEHLVQLSPSVLFDVASQHLAPNGRVVISFRQPHGMWTFELVDVDKLLQLDELFSSPLQLATK